MNGDVLTFDYDYISLIYGKEILIGKIDTVALPPMDVPIHNEA